MGKNKKWKRNAKRIKGICAVNRGSGILGAYCFNCKINMKLCKQYGYKVDEVNGFEGAYKDFPYKQQIRAIENMCKGGINQINQRIKVKKRYITQK